MVKDRWSQVQGPTNLLIILTSHLNTVDEKSAKHLLEIFPTADNIRNDLNQRLKDSSPLIIIVLNLVRMTVANHTAIGTMHLLRAGGQTVGAIG